jgi:hypothetical protein
LCYWVFSNAFFIPQLSLIKHSSRSVSSHSYHYFFLIKQINNRVINTIFFTLSIIKLLSVAHFWFGATALEIFLWILGAIFYLFHLYMIYIFLFNLMRLLVLIISLIVIQLYDYNHSFDYWIGRNPPVSIYSDLAFVINW